MEEKNLFDDISDVGNVALDTYETVNAEDLLNMLCAPFVGAEQQDFVILLFVLCPVYTGHLIAPKYFDTPDFAGVAI